MARPESALPRKSRRTSPSLAFLIPAKCSQAGRKEYCVIIGLQGVPQETLAQYDESWDKTYPIEHFGIDFSPYDIRCAAPCALASFSRSCYLCLLFRVQKLMKLARKVTPTVHIKRPILDSCVCDRARIVIVGEAAHPLVVSLALIYSLFGN